MTDDADRARRAHWPVKVYRLGEEPSDDLTATTTIEERFDMVRLLSGRMWELTGRPFPTYSRRDMPVVLVRR